jgi:hypothetical protein
VYNAWSAGTSSVDDIAGAQAAYAEACRIVACHLAASTVLNLDARLPRGIWKMTRDAANAMGATREANRPPEARQMMQDLHKMPWRWDPERALMTQHWDRLYAELERLLTDAFAPA